MDVSFSAFLLYQNKMRGNMMILYHFLVKCGIKNGYQICPTSHRSRVIVRARKYYLKNNYLTLRSKFKVPQRSLRYATHHLMVMHPHTKYHTILLFRVLWSLFSLLILYYDFISSLIFIKFIYRYNPKSLLV
jgi:hypothetical protein